MSIMRSIRQLSLLLCVLGLAAAFPSDDSPKKPDSKKVWEKFEAPVGDVKVPSFPRDFEETGGEIMDPHFACSRRGDQCENSNECCSGLCHRWVPTCA